MKFLRDNGLSLVLASLFLIFWGCQAWCGWLVYNEEQMLHGGPVAGFPAYLVSGHFWQATGENWESEFLQMGVYVVLTSFLYQRGSAESKDPDQPEAALPESTRRRFGWPYRHSLGLAFLALFVISFIVHAEGGLKEFNEKRHEHGEAAVSLRGFMGDAEFWFQSFQNWQSEFLAVLSIVGLSIFLRQHGSPESKAIDDPHSKTGS